MNGLADVAGVTLAVVRRDARLFVSYRLRFVTQLLTALFTLTLFYYLSRLVNVRSFAGPDQYFGFAVVGLVIVQVLNSSIALPPVNLRQELVAGTFERWVASPAGAPVVSVATLVFPFLLSVLTALIMLGLGSLLFGLNVQWVTVPLVIPASVLGFLAFAPFGVLVMAVVIVAKQALGATTFIVAGMSLVAGLYFPVSLLPGWIRWASEVQPFTPAVELMRFALLGRPLEHSVWADLAQLALFPAILFPVSIFALRGALAAGLRRGTIFEY